MHMFRMVSLSCLLSVGAFAAEVAEAPLLADVQFRVADARGAPMLSGVGTLSRGLFEVSHGSQSGYEGLTLWLESASAEQLVVRAKWVDDQGGVHVKWEPIVLVKRGAEAVVRFEFSGGARVLTVSAR